MRIIKSHAFWESIYGFHWGAADLERTASLDDGSVVITIRTKREILHIRVTKTGFIRTDKKVNHAKNSL